MRLDLGPPVCVPVRVCLSVSVSVSVPTGHFNWPPSISHAHSLLPSIPPFHPPLSLLHKRLCRVVGTWAGGRKSPGLCNSTLADADDGRETRGKGASEADEDQDHDEGRAGGADGGAKHEARAARCLRETERQREKDRQSEGETDKRRNRETEREKLQPSRVLPGASRFSPRRSLLSSLLSPLSSLLSRLWRHLPTSALACYSGAFLAGMHARLGVCA